MKRSFEFSQSDSDTLSCGRPRRAKTPQKHKQLVKLGWEFAEKEGARDVELEG